MILILIYVFFVPKQDQMFLFRYEMDYDDLRDYMDQDIPAGHYPTAESGPMAQFMTGIIG
jgi:hypothetical protein